MTERQRTVALLIDYDNLQICYSRDAPGTQLDLGAIITLAQNYGRVVVARAYAEWNLLSERLHVYKAGIEPAFAPVMRPEGSMREGKSLADTVMVADGVDILWKLEPDVLVLVTSDKDMIPLARLAKQRGCLVVVLGSDLTAVPLLEMANEFVTYRHLIKEMGRADDKIGPVRVREEPRLRRPRERVGTREVAAALEASAREPRSFQPRGRREAAGGSLAALPPAEATTRPPQGPGDAIWSFGDAAPTAAPEVPVGQPELTENGQPGPARRRRRRRRRPGTLGEQGVDQSLQEGLGGDETATDEDESEAAGPPLDVASGVDADLTAGADTSMDVKPPTRRRGARPRRQSAEPVRSAESRLEPLKPWERWPSSASQQVDTVDHVEGSGEAEVSDRAEIGDRAEAVDQVGANDQTAVAEQVTAADQPEGAEPSLAEQPAVLPTGVAEVANGADLERSIERAALPEEQVEVAVAADWSPAAATESKTEQKPARRRRTRRRPAAATSDESGTAPEAESPSGEAG